VTAPMVLPSETEVTAKRAAEMLGVSRSTVASLIFKKLLPARSVGRVYVIAVDDIESLKEQRPDLVSRASR